MAACTIYAAVREGNRVRKVYLGAGEAGRRAAETVEAARAFTRRSEASSCREMA